MKIGNKEINGKVVLAPMAGITSYGYRKFFEKFDIDFSYTEMVSDMGLLYENKETESYINFPKQSKPIGVQLFGFDPDNIAKAAKIVLSKNPNIDFIDVNMACPVPKVTKTGAGSALLRDPKKCGEIIRKLKEVTTLPISAKIRLGWDDNSLNYLEVIKELEDAGVSFIALHARTKKDLYYGKPKFEIIRDLRRKMRVPLIISGNIFSLEEAISALEITGADAVMLARGGEGNPYLANQINHYFKTGEKLTSPSLDKQIDFCLALARDLVEEKGEETAMKIYRSIAPTFFSGLPNIKSLKGELSSSLTTYDSLVNVINNYLSNNEFDYGKVK